jgi:hypothetical protein
MSFIYNMTLSDFTSGYFNPEQFIEEINSNVNVSPICTCILNTNNTDVDIYFDSLPSGSEKDVVDILATNHVEQPAPPTGEDIGLEGNIVGSTDNQTLENKTIDVSTNMITNIVDGNIKALAGINITKLANGSINNTEFQYLNGVTSSIQTQINGKSNTSHTHSGSDLTSGTISVSRGGTGNNSLSSGYILRGSGTGAITSTLAAPSGAIVGTTDIQTITNKTLTSTTNNISAKSLLSATTSVDIYGSSAPTSGQVLTATSSTVAEWQDASGGGVYGSQIQYGSSESYSSTTSTSWQQKLRLTTSSLPSGVYKIEWYYEWGYSSTSRDFIGRVQINDSTTIMEHREEPQDSGSDQYRPGNGFYYAPSLSGVTNIDLDYCTSSSGYTSRIRRARLSIFRIS